MNLGNNISNYCGARMGGILESQIPIITNVIALNNEIFFRLLVVENEIYHGSRTKH